MQFKRISLGCLVTLGLLNACGPSSNSSAAKETPSAVPVILDTDIGPDYDDVGAMAVLHALADSGYAMPVAVVASNANEFTVPVIDVLNTYFGRPHLPTGGPKSAGAPNMTSPQGWPQLLVEKYPHQAQPGAEVPDATRTYREVLALQPDTSVTIITVGFLTNLANLLESPPDAASPLSGKELIGKKVKRLVSMAGKFPEGREYNVFVDSTASEKVFGQWPTEIIFSGFEIGRDVITGLPLINDATVDSPVKAAYAKAIAFSKSDSAGRNSWDQTAVLVAIKGASPYYDLQKGRYVAKGGNNSWVNDPAGPHAYLVPRMPVPQVTALIEALMHHQKK
ncbi:hypothetical protein GCM10023091_05740 [Ravibacter arvi]|uniref:Inosine/uridine-preferring nucleoside hydrolase domain-containing protein n=1 Tax=Ravibacter arvi TaxID=2051041 RepID=A0ABP8LPP5_9BACT